MNSLEQTMNQASNQSQAKTTNHQKSVYFFGGGFTEGNASMKNLLGGKGANLAEMATLDVPVPPGFTITTEICTEFYRGGQKIPKTVETEILSALSRMEEAVGKKFGSNENPLLVSVRSGARASMPGMMDTILNLGLNDQTVEALAKKTGNPRFAWDSYRRFIQMFSDVVLGVNSSLLEVTLEDLKEEKHYKEDTQLTADDLKVLVEKFKRQIVDQTGQKFPSDPLDQMWKAISAVFKSWHTPRAITYRSLNSIPESWGTAVNVQAMVFGNMGDDSATGVAFTRDPSTGEKRFYGEYLPNAQGEDVVAGIRTPQPISIAGATGQKKVDGKISLEEMMPACYKQLVDIYHKLEAHYRDMQDIEFTIEKGKLWMLQTRNGKRTAAAAVRIAMEMLDEKMLDEKEAILRVSPSSLDQLLHPTLDPQAKKTLLAKGLPASPGAACGEVVFTSEEAEELKAKGKKVILVRVETSPEDIAGMHAAQGIFTTRGGMTSHAAVVARGMGKCCVAGCGDAQVDYIKEEMRVGGHVIQKGDILTLDGSTGEVFLGEVKTKSPELGGTFERVMTLADKHRRLRVRANADTPADAKVARQFGAEGVGLCRTEHMFFGPDRIDVVREMILAEDTTERKIALDKLLPMQRSDFVGIFKAMEGCPVTIRLLDPPLHEFLPHSNDEIKELGLRLNKDFDRLRSRIESLREFNPMLGHRGCRLGITYPEIYQMQVRAIAEATVELSRKGASKIIPEIMIPLIAWKKEFEVMKTLTENEVKAVQKESGVTFEYLIGTMIELPRAALTADEIAESAEFFSFGTNDLTQTTMGLSRDDAGKFLGTYVNSGLMEKDPFVSIDVQGVGTLVKMGVDLGRRSRPDLKVGICGEHGGDPQSISFFHKVGLNYVSCSPYRVPIARLAAAHAALTDKSS
jgi:pyruvate, orthophosphate dikinase